MHETVDLHVLIIIMIGPALKAWLITLHVDNSVHVLLELTQRAACHWLDYARRPRAIQGYVLMNF